MLFITILVAISCPALSTPSYSTWMTDSFLSTSPVIDFGYGGAVVSQALRLVAAKTGNKTYCKISKAAIDAIIAPQTKCPVSDLRTMACDYNYTLFSLDDVSVGVELITLYEETRDEKYWFWIEVLRRQINGQKRNPSGGFWHRVVYPNQMWLDGLFMAEPFYAQYTSFYDAENLTAWDDIVHQFDLIEENCHYYSPNQSGLLVHGYGETKKATWANPVTGSSPNVWDRAMGWYASALVDVLDFFPEDHPGRSRLLEYLASIAAALRTAQDISGGWWLVMNDPYPGMARNYIESSATALFTFALLKAMRKGYLRQDEYCDVVEGAYALMTERFAVQHDSGILTWEGTVSVGSLGSNASFEYYTSVPLKTNDMKGFSAFVWASYEWELYQRTVRK